MDQSFSLYIIQSPYLFLIIKAATSYQTEAAQQLYLHRLTFRGQRGQQQHGGPHTDQQTQTDTQTQIHVDS